MSFLTPIVMTINTLRYFISGGCLLTSFAGGAQGINDSVPVKDEPPVAIASDSVQSAPKSFHLYRENYWVSGSFCVVATAADIYAIPYVIKAKETITPQEIAGLNPSSFSSFDRWALNLNPANRNMYQKISDYSLPVLIVTPGLLALNKNIRKDWFRILLMYYEMHCFTFSLYNYSFFGPAFQNPSTDR